MSSKTITKNDLKTILDNVLPADQSTGTSIPTADKTAKFDTAAHMNSSDMSAQDISDFVDSLNASASDVQKVTFTTSTGSNYSGYGGCYYEKIGRLVHIHLGLSGLTASATNFIATISAIAPSHKMFGMGTGGATNTYCIVEVNDTGAIHVFTSTNAQYCGADLMYFV